MSGGGRMSSCENFYNKFCSYLEKEDKQGCAQFVLDAVVRRQIIIPELYEKILAPSLNNLTEREGKENLFIWNEHVRSSIIRTIIECCYPYVLREIAESGRCMDKGKVLLICPPEEYHELGARMGSDFFNLCGYSTVFVGSNTPVEVIISGIAIEKPKYVVISASNYYNLVAARKITDSVHAADSSIEILACGYAFRHEKSIIAVIGAKGIVNSIDDIMALEGDL
jgi:MerR family transcriptional regulator, light-induced transcriptional regulator